MTLKKPAPIIDPPPVHTEDLPGETHPDSPPEPLETHSPSPKPPLKVGMILGPGSSRSLAHIGVIRELVKAQIPIDSIVGIEWGALVGAMFANNGQVHDIEWKIYKLQRKDFLVKKTYFSPNLAQLKFDNSTHL